MGGAVRAAALVQAGGPLVSIGLACLMWIEKGLGGAPGRQRS